MHFNMLYLSFSLPFFFVSLLVPTAAPTNVQVGMLNNTSGVVRWAMPPPQHHNGILLGYKIQVKAGNSTKILAQMTLNSSTLSVGLHNLTTGATYSARVVAYTRVGAGPYSKPVNFSTRIKGIN
jgi:roundabout, axon guidance receptor 2